MKILQEVWNFYSDKKFDILLRNLLKFVINFEKYFFLYEKKSIFYEKKRNWFTLIFEGFEPTFKTNMNFYILISATDDKFEQKSKK